MHKRFDHAAIDKKWQKKWKDDGIYDAKERDHSKEKEYVLVELPYPSGNLHIGHWYAFGVPDIYVRLRRMQGKQVLFPMGFDAFGLPAENAAIKRDVNPREWTESNIEYMKEQLASMGNAFTWNMTASTIDPDYYRFTQWMFTKFFQEDIAYRGEGVVNWCPTDNTVIANEQVLADGTCERCGDTIQKKNMPQWMLRITDYADALIDDLDDLDWPEHIKDAQRSWIGRSQGSEIDFKLSTNDTVSVFTTRPDTLYGATYMVLAPEHALVEKNKTALTNWTEVQAYTKEAAQKKEMDRLDATKEKTGIKLEGITAINPASGEQIPIYIADYVLASYGTGAIMAVPAHDERDFKFAKKYKISAKFVIKPSRIYSSSQGTGTPTEIDTTELNKIHSLFETENQPVNLSHINWLPLFISDSTATLINSAEFNGMTSEEAKIAITKKVEGRMTNTYRLRDWSIGRQRYWGVPIPIVYDPEGKAHIVPEEHLPWTLPEDVDFKPTGEPPLTKSVELKKRTEDIFGKGWTPEVETMDTFVDSAWYFLRYIDPNNTDSFSSLEAQKDWMQVDTYLGGAEHTTMHLLYSRFWQKALKKLGLVEHNEPYKRRINHGMILGPDGNKMSKSKGNVVDPDEQVKNVGSDTVKMYLAFMGPYQDNSYPWDVGGLVGIHRFLERVNGLQAHIVDEEGSDVTKVLHKTIHKVKVDIEHFKFNTAISSLMIFINTAEKAGLSLSSYDVFLRLLAPFAPHLAEELWYDSGNVDSIHLADFPTYDAELAKDEMVTIGVQINGKIRGNITIAPDASEEEAVTAAEKVDQLKDRLGSADYKKVIYVPSKILNIIV